MELPRRLLTAMVLLIALPLGVAALAAIGLWRIDRILESVAEEYTEVRMLQPVDGSLKAAVVALRSDDPLSAEAADRHLADAEDALLRFMLAQGETVATTAHQTDEAGVALPLLSRLQALRSETGRVAPRSERAERASELHAELEQLVQTADAGVMASHQSARSTRKATVTAVYAASLLSAAICLGLLVWSSTDVLRRLRDLRSRLAAQATVRIPEPIGQRGGGVGEVVTQIESLNNRLLEKMEESGRELLRRERLAGIGLLAADVAHEINNPMNAMLGLTELGLRTLERGPVDEAARAELEESLRVVRREALRSKAIVDRLMAMVRSDRKATWFDAARLVRESVQVAQAARPDKAACFVAPNGGPVVRAYGPADDVRQILLTLLVNAADAIGPEGRIEVDATRADGEVWLRVRDDGRGFTEAMRRTFFTPFRSYGESGRGAGLGLSIAQALAEGMGASLRPFSDGPGRGSTFLLAIPERKEPT